MRGGVSKADGTAVGPSSSFICASITSSAEAGADPRSTRLPDPCGFGEPRGSGASTPPSRMAIDLDRDAFDLSRQGTRSRRGFRDPASSQKQHVAGSASAPIGAFPEPCLAEGYLGGREGVLG